MNSDTRNRMYEYEVAAPPAAWDHIAEALEFLQEDKQLAEKIGSIAVQPPAGAWSNIRKSLDDTEKEIPLQRKPHRIILPIRKLAIAAILIGCLVITAVLVNRRNTEDPVAVNTPTPVNSLPQQALTDTTKNTNDNAAIPGQIAKTGPIAGNTAGTVIKNRSQTVTEDNHSEESVVLASNRSSVDAIAHTGENNPATNGKTAALASSNADRYYNLLDENGNIVRVSKKITALDCVIKNGLIVPFDNSSNADPDCIEKVREWHKIMTDAPAITSPLDLLSVISSGT